MEKPCLNNKEEYPDDAVLGCYLGEAKRAWDSFTNLLKERDPLISGEWRYYNDGKNWLFKVTKKKNTICWVAVFDKKFKTTFYFADKAEELIAKSNLAKEYIDQFVDGKKYGKIRGVTVEINQPDDLAATKILMEIKEQLK